MSSWPHSFFIQIHIRFISGGNIWAGLQEDAAQTWSISSHVHVSYGGFQSLQVRAHMASQGMGQFSYSLLLP